MASPKEGRLRFLVISPEMSCKPSRDMDRFLGVMVNISMFLLVKPAVMTMRMHTSEPRERRKGMMTQRKRPAPIVRVLEVL